ncbi:MAG: flippase-like domain-containing protein [Chloroflexi bacterium]|nr:flippase-like domain-containing protein [Chloroflexota bacterium]
MNRQRLTILMGVAVALIATYFAVKDVSGEQLLAALAAADYRLVVPALLVAFSGYAARAWRWQLLIDPVKRVPFATIFPVLIIGFAWNVLVPLRIGELVRAHVLGVREQISRSTLLATVVVERVLDGVGIMALLGLVGALYPGLPGWVEDFTRIATLLFGIALCGLVMLIVSERFSLRLLGIVTARLPQAIASRATTLAEAFVRGYVALRSPGHLAGILLGTALAWLIEIGTYAILFVAFNVHMPPPTFAAASSFYAVVLNLATLVPSPPGYVATIEGFGVAALGAFNVEPAVALSLTVVGHAVQLAAIVVLGAWALWREGLSAFELLRSAGDSKE